MDVTATCLEDSLRVFARYDDSFLIPLFGFANQWKERPLQDLSSDYFQEPAQFVAMLLSVLDHLVKAVEARQDDTRDNLSQTAVDLYCSLFEAVRISHPVRAELIQSTNIPSLHQRLFFSDDQGLSREITSRIKSLCMDSTAYVISDPILEKRHKLTSSSTGQLKSRPCSGQISWKVCPVLMRSLSYAPTSTAWRPRC